MTDRLRALAEAANENHPGLWDHGDNRSVGPWAPACGQFVTRLRPKTVLLLLDVADAAKAFAITGDRSRWDELIDALSNLKEALR